MKLILRPKVVYIYIFYNDIHHQVKLNHHASILANQHKYPLTMKNRHYLGRHYLGLALLLGRTYTESFPYCIKSNLVLLYIFNIFKCTFVVKKYMID